MLGVDSIGLIFTAPVTKANNGIFGTILMSCPAYIWELARGKSVSVFQAAASVGRCSMVWLGMGQCGVAQYRGSRAELYIICFITVSFLFAFR